MIILQDKMDLRPFWNSSRYTEYSYYENEWTEEKFHLIKDFQKYLSSAIKDAVRKRAIQKNLVKLNSN